MATAKVNGLLFEGWWRESVEEEEGASVKFDDLWRAYRRAVGAPMGRQSFVARLNGLGLKETKRQGVRYRWGVKLRTTRPDMAAPERDRGSGVDALPPAGLNVVGSGDFPTTRAVLDIFRERVRQQKPVSEGGEGRSVAHDDADEWAEGALASAAAAYAYAASQRDELAPFLELNVKGERPPSRRGWLLIDFLRQVWPWSPMWWKPKTDESGWRRRCLVKSGALIIAAIEKIDRAEARELQRES